MLIAVFFFCNSKLEFGRDVTELAKDKKVEVAGYKIAASSSNINTCCRTGTLNYWWCIFISWVHFYRNEMNRNSPLRSCSRDLVITRLTMHHGTVLGDAGKKPVHQNSPVMHCQHRYSQASGTTLEWQIGSNYYRII